MNERKDKERGVRFGRCQIYGFFGDSDILKRDGNEVSGEKQRANRIDRMLHLYFNRSQCSCKVKTERTSGGNQMDEGRTRSVR